MSFIDDTYYDSFDCEVCIEEDPAFAAYEAQMEIAKAEGWVPCEVKVAAPAVDDGDDIPF